MYLGRRLSAVTPRECRTLWEGTRKSTQPCDCVLVQEHIWCSRTKVLERTIRHGSYLEEAVQDTCQEEEADLVYPEGSTEVYVGWA